MVHPLASGDGPLTVQEELVNAMRANLAAVEVPTGRKAVCR